MVKAPQKDSGIPVWTWRDAVRKAAVPPLTKLVCYSIANYLSDVGEGCFPSVKTLMRDSRLTNRSIATHLKRAEDAQLLRLERAVGKDGRFKRTTYFPRFPDNTTLPREREETDTRVKKVHPAKPGEGGSFGPRERSAENRVNVPREGGSRITIHKNIPTKFPSHGAVRSEELKSDFESEGQVKPADRPTPASAPRGLPPPRRAARFTARKGSPAFEKWLRFYEGLEREDIVGEMKLHGYINTLEELPPRPQQDGSVRSRSDNGASA